MRKRSRRVFFLIGRRRFALFVGDDEIDFVAVFDAIAA